MIFYAVHFSLKCCKYIFSSQCRTLENCCTYFCSFNIMLDVRISIQMLLSTVILFDINSTIVYISDLLERAPATKE